MNDKERRTLLLLLRDIEKLDDEYHARLEEIFPRGTRVSFFRSPHLPAAGKVGGYFLRKLLIQVDGEREPCYADPLNQYDKVRKMDGYEA